MIAGVRYQRIDDDGLHVTVGDQAKTLMVDHVILCAGQESERDLYARLREREVPTYLIGGAKKAGELDAVRAFERATRLAMQL